MQAVAGVNIAVIHILANSEAVYTNARIVTTKIVIHKQSGFFINPDDSGGCKTSKNINAC
jgi:hypothetical protein